MTRELRELRKFRSASLTAAVSRRARCVEHPGGYPGIRIGKAVRMLHG